MAAAAGPATPQRAPPGAYFNTPAAQPPPISIFTQHTQSSRQPQQQQQQQQQQQGQQQGQIAPQPAPSISSIERAARQINATLQAEASYPELDTYILQGVSGEYDIPKSAAWNPFQPLKWHDFPAKILEQANLGAIAMKMGFFAPIGRAWAAVDNALYLWDYTLPNPELIGFEEQRSTIEAVKLVKPKPGVFVKEVTHLIVVATTAEMLLLGVATTKTETGAKTIALYNTQMSIPVRGLGVKHIEASSKTGRIFFTGSQTEDIYEFKYQEQEGWFSGKTQRICHTKKGINFIDNGNLASITQYLGPSQKKTRLQRLAIDDTRDLMYSLSDNNEIKVWMVREMLSLALSKTFSSLMVKMHHTVPQTELLSTRQTFIESISVVPATESGAVSLVATTNSGCRLFLSVQAYAGSSANAQRAPTSMEIKQVRFPPPDPNRPAQPQGSSTAVPSYNQPSTGTVDTTSKLLWGTLRGDRFPPGYFLAVHPDPDNESREEMFCAAPDTARMSYDGGAQATHPGSRFSEFGQFIKMNGPVTSIQLIGEDFDAASTPLGFGNELAVQFDKPSTEVGILTANGIQTIRRRRLVDIFASLMRYSGTDDEGLDNDIKRFVRTYGRSETAATALAVACGQGMDVTPDSRVASVAEPDVLEKARSVFIEQGGKAEYNANSTVDGGIDSVKPSPRHSGLALYISRLVRSIWRVTVIKESLVPGVAVSLISTAPKEKLKRIQDDLNSLRKFLDNNKSFIDGLAGPQALGRLGSRQDEMALQGEHRAMTSLLTLVSSITEGISFVEVLFDERIEDILALLPEESRKKVRELTYETLFVSPAGRDLAKELVKAIVNRNIATGSNVETVAEALRRRCGSFCSADDVMIFKAQEQVKRAAEAGAGSESGRLLLNESLNLFKRVAGNLTIGDDGSEGHLSWAVNNYCSMHFYAGAIQLCLTVADERDKGKLALAYVRDDKPEIDSRKAAYDVRHQCYSWIFTVIQHLDKSSAEAKTSMAGQSAQDKQREHEAYDIIDSSTDYVFLSSLYDWYLETGHQERLLLIENEAVVRYLRQRTEQSLNIDAANLLWRYYMRHNDFLEASAIQLELAKDRQFKLNLSERQEYLARAKANASTRQSALIVSRQSRQQILREISDYQDLAEIQDEILQRMKSDERLSDERRPLVLQALNNNGILGVQELFNEYADQAAYHDICLLIYQVADHRNPADIRASWQAVIASESAAAVASRNAQPWDQVGNKVRDLGTKLSISDSTFPIKDILPLLARYATIDPAAQGAPEHWAISVLLALELEIPHEVLLSVLETLYYGNEHPFVGAQRRSLAGDIVFLAQQWLEESQRQGERVVFGSEEAAESVLSVLQGLVGARDALGGGQRREAEEILGVVGRGMR